MHLVLSQSLFQSIAFYSECPRALALYNAKLRPPQIISIECVAQPLHGYSKGDVYVVFPRSISRANTGSSAAGNAGRSSNLSAIFAHSLFSSGVVHQISGCQVAKTMSSHRQPPSLCPPGWLLGGHTKTSGPKRGFAQTIAQKSPLRLTANLSAIFAHSLFSSGVVHQIWLSGCQNDVFTSATTKPLPPSDALPRRSTPCCSTVPSSGRLWRAGLLHHGGSAALHCWSIDPSTLLRTDPLAHRNNGRLASPPSFAKRNGHACFIRRRASTGHR